jgi:GDP-L-fucose synthase
MDASTKIFVAGHGGLAGGAIVRELSIRGFERIATRAHAELDLEDALATRRFFESEQPEVVFLAAGFVGGIAANMDFPVDFLLRNLRIAANVIESAHATAVKRLIFLGSSCIYPRDCPQPMREEFLLTGPLEGSNRPYALAKIAGIEMCWAFNRQYASRYLAVMPTNLYGRGDNYDLQSSHVLPALMRKIHEAKMGGQDQVVIWGSGTPRREFLHADDLARALVFLADADEGVFATLTDPARCPLINIGTGSDLTIRELAHELAAVIGFDGRFVYDDSKPDGTPRKVLDVSRVRALGWAPQLDLKAGLVAAYRDFLQSGFAQTAEPSRQVAGASR